MRSHAIQRSEGHSAPPTPACRSAVAQLHAAGGTHLALPATTPSAVRGGLTQQHLTGRREHCGASHSLQQPGHSEARPCCIAGRAPRPGPRGGRSPGGGTAPGRGRGSAGPGEGGRPGGALPAADTVWSRAGAAARPVLPRVPLAALPKAPGPASRMVRGRARQRFPTVEVIMNDGGTFHNSRSAVVTHPAVVMA